MGLNRAKGEIRGKRVLKAQVLELVSLSGRNTGRGNQPWDQGGVLNRQTLPGPEDRRETEDRWAGVTAL